MTEVRLGESRTPPGMRIYAIGDVHGRADLLARLHRRIAGEIRDKPPQDCRIIHIGDYCDRGSNTRGVFDMLTKRTANHRVLALAGNHDAAMLDFLEQPHPHGLFVTHGGIDTAWSYGVEADFSSNSRILKTCVELNEAIPASHVAFLEKLPRKLVFGDYYFCHAGIRPGVPLDRQSDDDLVWIRKEFLGSSVLHEKVVVHGHTPRDRPEALPNRINIDTGAWETGTLTAVVLEDDAFRFIDVQG